MVFKTEADAKKAPKERRSAPSTHRKYVVDWTVYGSFEVMAASADEAQAAFDKAWGSPRGINPMRDGEVQNEPPVVAKD